MNMTKDRLSFKLQEKYLDNLCPKCRIRESEITSWISGEHYNVCKICYQEQMNEYFAIIKRYKDIVLLSTDLAKTRLKTEQKFEILSTQLKNSSIIHLPESLDLLSNSFYYILSDYFKEKHYPKLYPTKEKEIDLIIKFHRLETQYTSDTTFKESIFEILTAKNYKSKLTTSEKFDRLFFVTDYYNKKIETIDLSDAQFPLNSGG